MPVRHVALGALAALSCQWQASGVEDVQAMVQKNAEVKAHHVARVSYNVRDMDAAAPFPDGDWESFQVCTDDEIKEYQTSMMKRRHEENEAIEAENRKAEQEERVLWRKREAVGGLGALKQQEDEKMRESQASKDGANASASTGTRNSKMLQSLNQTLTKHGAWVPVMMNESLDAVKNTWEPVVLKFIKAIFLLVDSKSSNWQNSTIEGTLMSIPDNVEKMTKSLDAALMNGMKRFDDSLTAVVPLLPEKLKNLSSLNLTAPDPNTEDPMAWMDYMVRKVVPIILTEIDPKLTGIMVAMGNMPDALDPNFDKYIMNDLVNAIVGFVLDSQNMTMDDVMKGAATQLGNALGKMGNMGNMSGIFGGAGGFPFPMGGSEEEEQMTNGMDSMNLKARTGRKNSKEAAQLMLTRQKVSLANANVPTDLPPQQERTCRTCQEVYDELTVSPGDMNCCFSQCFSGMSKCIFGMNDECLSGMVPCAHCNARRLHQLDKCQKVNTNARLVTKLSSLTAILEDGTQDFVPKISKWLAEP